MARVPAALVWSALFALAACGDGAAPAGGALDAGAGDRDAQAADARVSNMQPDAALDAALPDATPDAAQPDATLDAAAPDAAQPDAAAPDAAAPDAEVPDSGAACEIGGVLYADGAPSPTDPCQRCDLAAAPNAWTPASDGAPCGAGRVCVAAACLDGCFVDGAHRAPDSLDPANDCEACVPASSTSAWTPRPDESACGVGQYCRGAVCTSTWHGTTPAGLTPVYGGSSAASLDGRIFLFGAVATSLPGRLSQVYDPATQTVTPIADPPYTPYRSCAVTALDGRVYVMGGVPASSPVATMVVYDPLMNTYSTAPALPFPSLEHSCALGLDGRIYVFATDDAARPGDLFVTTHTMIFDPVTQVWTAGAPMPTPRQRTVAVRLRDGRIVVSGGNRGYIFGALSTLTEIYSPTTDTWTTGAPRPSPLHWDVGGLRADGRVVVGGGLSGVYPEGTRTYVYDPLLDVWTDGLPTTDEHYAGYAATTPDGVLYFLTGRWTGSQMIPTVDACY